MKRFLSWNLERVRGDSQAEGPSYYLDHNYTAGALRIMATQAPVRDMKIDIRIDGTSVFQNYATLNKGANLEENAEDYLAVETELADGSVANLYVIDSGDAAGVTVQWEIYTEADDDDDNTDSDDQDTPD